MSNLPARANESPSYDFGSQAQITSYPTQTKIVSTVALLILGYYALSFFDAWPSTIKRSIYEVILYLIPSPLIYAMQYGLVRLGHLAPEEAKFKPANFGDMLAKQEAVRRIFGQPQLPLALRKVRTLSGPLMSLGSDVGPPGLGNWDNSCYQNSVLQGFASLPAFFEYMVESEKLCDTYDIPAPTHRALVAFLEQLADSSCRTTVLWTPRVLKSMDSWQQQDAQEYFSRVLEAVEKEVKQYSKRLRRSITAGLQCLETVEPSDATTQVVPDGRTAVRQGRSVGRNGSSSNLPRHELRNPIEGMTAQCLVCETCGFTEGLSLTQFNCLTLNLGLQRESNVEALLDEFTAPEDIEGVECENCTRLARAETGPKATEVPDKEAEDSSKDAEKKIQSVLRTKAKQITVGRLPKDLVLHINRSIFDNYGNQLKNTAPVSFPARLDFLGRWCAPLDAKDNAVEAVYELKCVVTHYGSHHDGHYIALGKRNKDWFSFNDERVTKISEDEVLARGNAFMLFYEAVSSLPSRGPHKEAADQEIASPIRTGLDMDEVEAGFPRTHRGSAPDQMNAPEDIMSKLSDDDILGSSSETAIDSDASPDTTPASSESSSPFKTPAQVHDKQNGLIFPAMKTASDVPEHTQDAHATGSPVVSVL
ncbi:ubiquitin thiolesterase [Cladophialophora carrionii]|uniref:ubiquitinyl hydrolase 1 n=1 Tax=Cladophialophora carrionii TaxID=86049 RepID=A0A1C1C9M1_9EURO|nr:ubiquitin thiolesterase [Cladophialophora carrionii]